MTGKYGAKEGVLVITDNGNIGRLFSALASMGYGRDDIVHIDHVFMIAECLFHQFELVIYDLDMRVDHGQARRILENCKSDFLFGGAKIIFMDVCEPAKENPFLGILKEDGFVYLCCEQEIIGAEIRRALNPGFF